MLVKVVLVYGSRVLITKQLNTKCRTNTMCITTIVRDYGPFYKHGFTPFIAWISNYIRHKLRDGFTHPFSSFSGGAIEVWEWASYQIRKIVGCACAGNAGNVSPRPQFQRKPLVSDPGMHHGTCVTHVPWYMSGSLTCDDGENVPGIPGACAPAILRIWQEAHGKVTSPHTLLGMC